MLASLRTAGPSLADKTNKRNSGRDGEGGRDTHLFRYNTLVSQVSGHALHQLNLLLWAQASDGSLKDRSNIDLVKCNKSVVVHVREETHDELAVHAIRHAAVSWNRIAKVLNLEATLQT